MESVGREVILPAQESVKTEKSAGGGRYSGIELFRIISMLLIIAHHYVVTNEVFSVAIANITSARSICMLIFGAFGKTGINCFVLITGYFMCKSKITLRKFLKLLGEVEFYKIIIYCIFLATGYENFTLKGLCEAIFPIRSVTSSFIDCYLLFYLFIPFINILIHNLNQKQHALLAALTIFIYVIMSSTPEVAVNVNYVSWFIVLYLVASFIRLYPKKLFDKRILWGMLAIVSFALASLSVACCAWLTVKLEDFTDMFYFVADSNKIFAFTTALCAFLFFKSFTFKSKIINTIASATFGVLLIHDTSGTMCIWLWNTVFHNAEHFYDKYFLLHGVLSVLIVYVVCTAIDLVRIYAIEKPLFKLYDKKFAYKRFK